jgi:hypothetical protein
VQLIKQTGALVMPALGMGTLPPAQRMNNVFDMKRADDVLPELVPIDMISCNMDLYNRTTRTYTDLLVWGASLLPTAAEGIRRGGHISIGRSVGRPVASPDQARKMLALK